MTKSARLSQLFDVGQVLELPTTSGPPEVVWVNKLNTFHVEECTHEGRVARARRMFAVREMGSAEYDLFNNDMDSLTLDAVIERLVDGRSDEMLYEVFAEIRSDDEWRDKLEVMEHSDIDSVEVSEKDLLNKLAEDYQNEIVKRLDAAKKEFREELEQLSDDQVRQQFRDQYVDRIGLLTFTDVRQRHELFHCLRECSGVRDENDRWDHSKCDHSVRYLTSPDEVKLLQDEQVTLIRAALAAVTVPTDVARFTDGPASSSESSGPSTKAEESTPSSPEAPSPTPATTS